jgi:hypothetical protein
VDRAHRVEHGHHSAFEFLAELLDGDYWVGNAEGCSPVATIDGQRSVNIQRFREG